MSEGEEVKRRRRRSSQEIQRLVAEFGTSGMRRSEFCRMHGLTHGTLQRAEIFPAAFTFRKSSDDEFLLEPSL
jgi:hypothetical protein